MKRNFIVFIMIILFLLAACGRKEDSVVVIPSLPSPTAETVVNVQDIATPAPTATPEPEEEPEEYDEPVQEPAYAPEPEYYPAPAPADRAAIVLGTLTTEEKIGQLVMFGFSGTSAIPAEFKDILSDYAVGNICLYGGNIAQDQNDGGFAKCKKLTDSLTDLMTSGVPPLIAIDVEGGSVTRFYWRPSPLSAKKLGSTGDADKAFSQFYTVGEGLYDAGISLNLAPVMDVAKNPDSTFLGTRIISSDADMVSFIGTACIQGLHETGTLSMVKHFPGHGATQLDSHELLPAIKKDMDELWEYELIPFEAAIEAGVDGVMVGHLSYPYLDNGRPASQSPYWISEVLRGDLGFEGLVMSDDFRMQGLQKFAPVDEAAVNFILAGGDLILCGPNHTLQKKIMEGLTDAVYRGYITEERLDESVYRILKAKEKAAVTSPQL